MAEIDSSSRVREDGPAFVADCLYEFTNTQAARNADNDITQANQEMAPVAIFFCCFHTLAVHSGGVKLLQTATRSSENLLINKREGKFQMKTNLICAAGMESDL